MSEERETSSRMPTESNSQQELVLLFSPFMITGPVTQNHYTRSEYGPELFPFKFRSKRGRARARDLHYDFIITEFIISVGFFSSQLRSNTLRSCLVFI